MKKYLIGGLIIPFLFSCKQSKDDQKTDITRDAFLGVKLGIGRSGVDSTFQAMLKARILNSYKNKFAYGEHTLPDRNKYYSYISFGIPKSDSLLTSLSVFYLDEMNDQSYYYFDYNANGTRMMQHISPSASVTDKRMVSDIVYYLKEKYGAYNYSDTIELSQDKLATYMWENKNDVDIELKHYFYDAFDPLYNETRRFYMIRLNYRLTDEYQNKLAIKKSIY